MNGLAIKNLAHAIAIVAHEGQSRKGLGEPYIEHVERVAEGVYGWRSKAIAYLHDVVEDEHLTIDALRDVGIPDDILNGVIALTRRFYDEDETYSEFIERIILYADEDFIKIKIADINDNMRDIDDTDMPGKKKQYIKALARLEDALETGN